MCIVDTQPASRSVTADRMNTPAPMILRTLLFGALSLFLGCSHQSSSLQAELFPETQQPCNAVGGHRPLIGCWLLIDVRD